VYIGEREATAAQAKFPRSQAVLLPLTLTQSEWPTASECSNGETVIVAGNLAQARNAEGLAEVLGELERRGSRGALPFVLVSDAGLHDSLSPFLAHEWVRHAQPGENLYDRYRQSRIALVPGTRATGLKTTILQAWATGCPVLAHEASAQTVGAAGQDALVKGANASQLADALHELFRNSARREQLAASGFAQLAHRFNPEVGRRRLLRLIAETGTEARPR
jgi:glycosyltransferase involved in cell wall biosynthesis